MISLREFTPDDYPPLVAVHAAQQIPWPPRPNRPEEWAAADRRADPRCRSGRCVAVEDGQVVGWAGYSQFAGDYDPHRFQVDVEVLPGCQRRVIGSALYDRLLASLAPFDPRVLRADAFTHLPQGFAFLQERGFFEAFRETPVCLDVRAFDPSPYAGLEPSLNAQGIFIKTVPELASDPNRDRKIFDMYCAAMADVPSENLAAEPITFESWLEWGLRDPSILLDAYLIAVRGEEYVALREVGEYGGGALLGSLMGVRRDARGRGIAQALMLRNVAFARERGYALVRDCTAVQNAPMQALFNRLGFTRDPEWQQCQKDIV